MTNTNNKKSVDDLLNTLNEFKPAIPDEVVNYYLRRTGFQCSDPKIVRLISLAAQKFISEVCTDSYHYCKIRQQTPLYRDRVQPTTKERRFVLTTDDIAQSVKEYGINIKKPEYYADKPTTGLK